MTSRWQILADRMSHYCSKPKISQIWSVFWSGKISQILSVFWSGKILQISSVFWSGEIFPISRVFWSGRTRNRSWTNWTKPGFRKRAKSVVTQRTSRSTTPSSPLRRFWPSKMASKIRWQVSPSISWGRQLRGHLERKRSRERSCAECWTLR